MRIDLNTEELEARASADGEFKPIPAGKYNAMITECRLETKPAGEPKVDNTQLTFKFRIQDGPHAKRTFFWQVFTSFTNMKPGAEGIFARQLLNLMKAVGLQGEVKDTDEFLNKECQIQITKELNNKDEETNKVDGNKFEPLAVNTRGTVTNATPAAPSRAQSAYSASNPPAAPRRRG